VRRRDRLWVVAAVGVCCLSFAVAFDGFWGNSLRESAPIPSALLPDGERAERRVKPVLQADYRLAAWAVGRNAWALLNEPLRIFQAEPCHPVDNTLALHHPVLSPALLAVPAQAISGDPVVAFNTAFFLKIAVGFAAMFLLVADWTRSAPAGIVAALLYAFHAEQIEHPYHLFTSDNAWMLFGLYFARRLFEHGRTRDALGLAAACLLQMGASFYPFFAAALTALPVLGWLVWHTGAKRLPLGPLLLVLAIVGAGSLVLFAPYLGHEGGEIRGRSQMFYAAWSSFLPGGAHFLGWFGLLLAVLAFALGRRRALAGISGDPRAALVLAAALVAVFATGGNHHARMLVLTGAEPPPFLLPNPFGILAKSLPGLAGVRLPGEFALAVRELGCILAGLGAAALLRCLPSRAATPASIVLIAVAFGVTLGTPVPLGDTRPAFAALRIRPPDSTIAFFAALAADGNRGPLLELPADREDRSYVFLRAPEQQLLTAYHHRRSSGCYVSFIPEAVRGLGALDRELPAPEAVARVRELGFTTVVVHHGEQLPAGAKLEARLRRSVAAGDFGLEPLATAPGLSAWAVRGTTK
jgi:hypothetical protein